MMIKYIFYFLAFVSVFSALMVVVSKNPVHCVLYLIMCFFSIAGHYILLNAQFLAAVHVIVYAGAIMVLFLFVIMLLNLNTQSEPHKSTWLKFAAAITSGLLLVILVGTLKGSETMVMPVGNPNAGLIKNLGNTLFKDFLLPFEVSSILFLVAMVGAVMLGKNEIK